MDFEQELQTLEDAASLVLLLMSAVPRGTISPKRWWDRATSGLSQAAERSYSWSSLISSACQALQVATLPKKQALALCSLGAHLGADEAGFEGFRRVCEDQAVYVVALARSMREELKDKSKTPRISRRQAASASWAALNEVF